MSRVQAELEKFSDPEKAAFFPRFFKTGPGEYGEGDRFIGVTVPNQRKVAKKFFRQATLTELRELVTSGIHEHRQTALFMLVYRFERASQDEKKEIVDFYLEHVDYVNNWDLVDSSADKILGAWLYDKPRDLLYEFARSNHLWKKRIAMMSTFYYIKKNQYEDALNIAEILLKDSHDLIHKAVGWMLREIGKRDLDVELEFLKRHYREMPRTMLRYAIERFDPELRERFLKGLI